MRPRPARTIFIVSRQHADLYNYLRDRFATDPNVAVILDRRTGTSNEQVHAAEKRQHPEVETELLTRSHAILTLPAVDSSP